MRKLLLIICIPLVLQACKKEESPDPASTNRTPSNFPGAMAQIIIANKWKLTNKQVDYSNGLPSEDFSNVPACQKDNVLSFYKTKKYDEDEAIDICPGKPTTTTYDWNISDDEGTITLNNVNWQLVSVNSSTMVLRNINSSQVLTVTSTATYTAQ